MYFLYKIRNQNVIEKLHAYNIQTVKEIIFTIRMR